MNTIWYIVIAVVGLLLIWGVSGYNKLVKMRNRVKNAWSQIDVQLQRRFDLIPNLVDTVKGYMTHEQVTLTQIAELRTSWAGAKTVADKSELNNQLSSALKTIMAVSEHYPELKANQNFIALQTELSNTENKISHSRQFYNDTVTMYNDKTQMFPSNILAGLFGFKQESLFTLDTPKAKQNVRVNFNR